MDDTLRRLEQKQDKILAEITDIKIDVAKHIQRTEIAEANIEMLRGDFKPIQQHVYMVNGALKFVGLLSLLSGIGLTLAKIFG